MTRQEKRQQAWRLRRFKWQYCGLCWYLLLAAVVPLALALSFGLMWVLNPETLAALKGQELTDVLRAALCSALWALFCAALWLWVTHPMEQCLRAAQKNGLADQLLEDWAGASPFFKKRGLWLGKCYLFVGGLGPLFIGYDEIKEISYPAFPEGYAGYILDMRLWPSGKHFLHDGYTRQERAEAYAKLPRDPTEAKHQVTAPMLVVWLKSGRKLTIATSRWPSGAAYAQERALLRDYVRYRMQNPPRPSNNGTSHRMA